MPKKISKQIDQYTERAMAAAIDKEPIPAGVYLPPAIRGKSVNVAYQIPKDAVAVDIKSNMVKITAEADPIGQLTAIANGQPVVFFDVDSNGKIVKKYETASMTQRIRLLLWLGDRVMPRISVTKKYGDKDALEDGEGDEWAATIENASQGEVS